MAEQKIDNILEKTHTLVVKVVNFQKKYAINDNVKIFRLEKEPISPQQWAENLKNGAPSKRLILSKNTDSKGTVTAELTSGSYEVKLETHGLSKICELNQNDEVLLIEPKKHWW